MKACIASAGLSFIVRYFCTHEAWSLHCIIYYSVQKVIRDVGNHLPVAVLPDILAQDYMWFPIVVTVIKVVYIAYEMFFLEKL